MIGFAKRLAAEARDKGPRLLGTQRMAFRRWRRNPRKILLLKTWNDRLGDLVLVSGALRHYRRLYDACRLEMACADSFVDYFRHCPHVDAVVPLSKFSTSRQRYSNASPWNAGRYDHVILLRRTPNRRDYELLDSFRPAWTAGITGDHLLIAPEEAEAYETRLDRAAPVALRNPPAHELEIQAGLLRTLGAEIHGVDDVWPECWTGAADSAKVEEWLGGKNMCRPVVVVAPCGSAPIRDWNVQGFRQILDSLPACTLVWAGGARDGEFLADMNWPAPVHIRRLDLVGKTTINELAEILRRADLVVAAESAVFHLAAALRRPAVCLAGGGHWGRFVPWGGGDRTRVLTHRLDCFGCGWECHRTSVECLQSISTDEVMRAARELLEIGRAK